MIQLKRAYEKPSRRDGVRILVDRLWPRGVSKDEARIALWLKDIVPSTALRKWFAHDPAKWHTFRRRYFNELKKHPEEIAEITRRADRGTVCLVFAAKDKEHSHALAVKQFLEAREGVK